MDLLFKNIQFSSTGKPVIKIAEIKMASRDKQSLPTRNLTIQSEYDKVTCYFLGQATRNFYRCILVERTGRLAEPTCVSRHTNQ